MPKFRLYTTVFAVLLGIYIVFALFLPPDPTAVEKYHISAVQVRLLTLTLVIPLLAIYCAAFYGFIRFRMYADVVKREPEGEGIDTIADGLKWLAYGLPFYAIFSNIFNYYARAHVGFRPAAVIMQNYLTLIITFTGFTIIYKGAGRLVRYLQKKPSNREQNYWMFGMIILSTVYSFFILNRPLYTDSARQIYYLPNWLIITTLAIPYLYMWYIGLKASYWVYFYQANVKGRLYQRALANLAIGLMWVIFSSIILQFFMTLSNRLNNLALAPLLITIYVLLILISIGYLLIAAGANRLKKLEEV